VGDAAQGEVAGPAAHPPELQQFLLYLGSALTAAGEAVNEIQDHLVVVAAAYGAPDARFAVLPTFVVVSLEPSTPVTLEPTPQLRGVLRLDQTSALFDVLKLARVGAVDPGDGWRQIHEIVQMRPRFNAPTRLVGHVVLTVGLCLVLQPTGADLLLAAAFGAIVGAIKEVGGRWVRFQMVMPVIAAFVVSATTFALANRGWAEADLRAMIAPLVTFLPGAALTTAVIELSAAQLVTGASRLVAGSLQLMLLAFGIVAAAEAAGVPTTESLVNAPENLLGWWAPWLGVVVFGVGVSVFNSAPRGSFPWLFLVLLVTWMGQFFGSVAFGGYASGFFGALVMVPAARLVERMPKGPPSLVAFLPAFWLLVPGALGLIGVTEYLSADTTAGLQDFVGALAAILAIALGVLCGYPIVGSVSYAVRRAKTLPVPWIEPQEHP
jgi:uncharacterized membrane protein YjjP (DUF1212 family)